MRNTNTWIIIILSVWIIAGYNNTRVYRDIYCMVIAGSVHKSRVDSVVRMWMQLKSVSCVWVLQREHSGDECDLASTLCKYELRKGDLLGKDATSEAGKYFFSPANVCWRCAHYFVITFCG